MAKPTSLARFAWLSIATALATIALKAIAYVMNGSVGLLSDALESLVNLVAAVLALLMLSVSARPPDEDHAYGHTKAEYFASGAEGLLILVAAVAIGWAAVLRLIEPRQLEKVGLGLVVSTGADLEFLHGPHPARRWTALSIDRARGRCAAPAHRRVDVG